MKRDSQSRESQRRGSLTSVYKSADILGSFFFFLIVDWLKQTAKVFFRTEPKFEPPHAKSEAEFVV